MKRGNEFNTVHFRSTVFSLSSCCFLFCCAHSKIFFLPGSLESWRNLIASAVDVRFLLLLFLVHFTHCLSHCFHSRFQIWSDAGGAGGWPLVHTVSVKNKHFALLVPFRQIGMIPKNCTSDFYCARLFYVLNVRVIYRISTGCVEMKPRIVIPLGDGRWSGRFASSRRGSPLSLAIYLRWFNFRLSSLASTQCRYILFGSDSSLMGPLDNPIITAERWCGKGDPWGDFLSLLKQ